MISRELRCSKHFIRFSLWVDVVPETWHRAQKSAIDAYDEYLWQQWQAGERNARELLRQIQAQGCPNGYKRVHQWVLARRIEEAEHPEGRPERPAVKGPWEGSDFLAGQIVWLLLNDDDRLQERDRTLFDKLKEKCPDLVALRQLAQGFRRLMREGTEADLDAW